MSNVRPQYLIRIYDDTLGFMGYLAIDSYVRNTAFGGIRVKRGSNDLNPAYEKEVAYLAREMTLKFGFHGIPLGGAKAIIILPEDLSQRQRDSYFEAFGRQLAPLLKRGVFNTGQDMGMNERDLHFVVKGAGMGNGSVIPETKGPSDSGRFTALGIIQTFQTMCEQFNWHPKEMTCGLEGFGSVGANLARFLQNKGVKIVALSTLEGAIYKKEGLNLDLLLSLQEEHGDEFVKYYKDAKKLTKEKLFSQDMDVLFPCGGLLSINEKNVRKIKSKAVITGSNCSMDEDLVPVLEKKNIIYIPGFVANAGSVLKSHVKKELKLNASREMEVEIERLFSLRVCNLLRDSQSQECSVYDQAVRIARSHIKEMNNIKVSLTKKVRQRIGLMIKAI